MIADHIETMWLLTTHIIMLRRSTFSPFSSNFFHFFLINTLLSNFSKTDWQHIKEQHEVKSRPIIEKPCLTTDDFADAELQEMIDRTDSDKNGEINFEDFYTIITKKKFV